MAFVPLSALQYRENIIAYLTSRKSGLSNFKPGSRIGTLIEAVALELAAADTQYYRAYLEGIREACFASFGFALKEGRRATGQVRIYNTDPPQRIVIPAFRITLFGLAYLSESSPPVLEASQTYIDLSINAEEAGSHYNIAANSIDTERGAGLLEPSIVPEPERITNLRSIEGGTDQESRAERERRFQSFIQNLARVTKGGIEAAVKSIAGVAEAYVENNRNPITGAVEYGWVNVYVSDGTANTNQDFLDRVRDILLGKSAANDFTEHIAAGKRLFVQALRVLAIHINVALSIDASSALQDEMRIKEIVQGAIANFVNRLKAGEDVLLDHVKSAVLQERPRDFLYINIAGNDIAVQPRELPRIGGAGGGRVTVSSITRIARP